MNTKKQFLVKGMLYAIFFTNSPTTFGQDTLYFNKGKSNSIVEVLQVNDTHIIFRRYGKVNSPTFNLNRKGFDKLVYSDGSIEHLIKFGPKRELFSANRQYLKGGVLVGGNVDFVFNTIGRQNGPSNSLVETSVTLQPQIGVFIDRNLAIGVLAAIQRQSVISELYEFPALRRNTSFMTRNVLGVFTRYTVYITDHSAFFTQANMAYLSGHEKYSGASNYENTVQGAYMGFRQGISLFLSDKFIVDFGIGGVDINLQKIVRKEKEAEEKFNQNSVTASFLSFSLGLTMVFTGKEKPDLSPFEGGQQ